MLAKNLEQAQTSHDAHDRLEVCCSVSDILIRSMDKRQKLVVIRYNFTLLLEVNTL